MKFLNKIQENIKNIKCGKIENLFNIKSINNGVIMINKHKEGTDYKIYIYEIIPLILINLDKNIVDNVIKNYTSFLKIMDINFQIYIIKNKFEIKKYLKYIDDINKDIKQEKYMLCSNYRQELLNMLSSEKIFMNKFYIIVSSKNININDLNIKMNELNNIGCKVNLLTDIIQIERILYCSINKGMNNECI